MAQLKSGSTAGGEVIATRDWVTSTIIGGAPAALDTLNELAAAIGDNASYAASITTALAGKLSTTGKAADSDKVDGYHASNLWRSDGATWNPSANISLNQSANSQEWSFDIRRNGYSGGYWQVWDSELSTMLKVDASSGRVYAPYDFVGNLQGNITGSAASATTAGSATTATTASNLGAHYTADTWFRATGDNNTVKFYGNSRMMVFRTDGEGGDTGHTGYAFKWTYGGDGSGNSLMLLDNNGNVWTKSYGWLHSRFEASGTAQTVVDAAKEELLNGAISTAQTTADNAATAASNAQGTANTALARADAAREDTVAIGELATAAQAAADAAQATADGKLGATAKAADSQKVDGINGASLLRSDANDTFTGTLTMGKQHALVANNYGRGVYGVYSSTRYQHVWGMGTAYNLADNGTGTGNLYGIAWTHQNIGGESISGLGHQMLIMSNGDTRSAIGDGIWTKYNIYASGGNSTEWNTAYDWGNHAGLYDGAGSADAVNTRIDNEVFPALDDLGNAIPTNNNQLTNGAGYITDLPNAGVGAGTYGSTSNQTKIDTITVDAKGRVTAVATGTGGDITTVRLVDDAGSYVQDTGGTAVLTIAGGTGISTSASGTTITVTNDEAGAADAVNQRIDEEIIPAIDTKLASNGKAADSNLLDGINSTSFLRSDANDTHSGQLALTSITAAAGTIANTKGSYLHIGAWGTGRTAADAVLVNTAYRADYATNLFNENISRFTNDANYLTQDALTSVEEGLRAEINTAQTTADSKLGATAKAADANKLDGYDWMQSGKSVRANDFYADNWFRNYNSNEGMYNQATGQHFYSDDDDYWNIAGGTAANGLRFRDEHAGTIRGYVYANSSNQVGFLDAGGTWAIKHVNDSHTEFLDAGEKVFSVGQGGHSSNYGTVSTHGDGRGGWEGYSINGRFVWMSSDSSMSGMYNDTDNEWMTQYHRNGAVKLYNNGGLRFETQSGGAKVHGTMTATAFVGDGSGLTGISAGADPVTFEDATRGTSSTLVSMAFDGRAMIFTMADGSQFAIDGARPNK